MISVGIDVSKGKSTICIMKPLGEVVKAPFEVLHTKSGLDELVAQIDGLPDLRVVMESTGIYHYPVLTHLKEHNFFVCVVNPLSMKKYIDLSLRKSKTDKKDAIRIANFGLDNWYHLTDCIPTEATYEELRTLSRQYSHYMALHVREKNNLSLLLEKTMPGIKSLSISKTDLPQQSKLCYIVQRYWHYDNITQMGEKRFIADYCNWATKKGYRSNEKKAHQIYTLAQNGIPTLSSSTPSTKMLVQEATRILLETDRILSLILIQMRDLAKQLKEYELVLSMPGVGATLAPLIIAEIGDVRRFHSGSALVAYAGIDAPAYQSGAFTSVNRRISKRGSSGLRKIGFQIMTAVGRVKPSTDTAVFDYICKKLAEGKPKKLAKIAGLNKFLRIYYARVMELSSL